MVRRIAPAFYTRCRSLTTQQGLGDDDAAEAMALAVTSLAGS
jgi:hypothetical protein